MNRNVLAKGYSLLTPEERFSLILSANDRGDTAEAERLASSAPSTSLTAPDYFSFSLAFRDVAGFMFLHVLNIVIDLFDCFSVAFGPREWDQCEDADAKRDAPGELSDTRTADASMAAAEAESAQDGGGERSRRKRCLDLARACAYVLKTHVAGWKLFCDRRHVPPFRLWRLFPGWTRLEDALDVAERILNRHRPPGAPELPEPPFSAEGTACLMEWYFQQRVRSWGGEPASADDWPEISLVNPDQGNDLDRPGACIDERATNG